MKRQEFGSLIEKHKAQALVRAQEKITTISNVLFENRIAFTVSEVAFSIGVSTRTIERQIQIGKLKSLRVGRRQLISKTELEAWLHSKKE